MRVMGSFLRRAFCEKVRVEKSIERVQGEDN